MSICMCVHITNSLYKEILIFNFYRKRNTDCLHFSNRYMGEENPYEVRKKKGKGRCKICIRCDFSN